MSKRPECKHPKWARIVEKWLETCSLCGKHRDRLDGWQLVGPNGGEGGVWRGGDR